MDEQVRDAWMKARPRLVSDLLARRVLLRGAPSMVLQDPATGRHWRAGTDLYRVAHLLDGRRDVATALRLAGIAPGDDDAAMLRGLSDMASAGLLRAPGLRRDPARPPLSATTRALLQRVIFSRMPLGDLGPAMPWAAALLGWLYGRTGTVVFAGLLAAAAWAWSGQGREISAQLERLTQLGAGHLLIGWMLFVIAKMLHELGHAVAAQRAAAREGITLRSFRWGISFMFLIPTPYVDVSAAWLIADRWRRCQVGLAGIQVDLLVAALAALAWIEVGEGATSDRLFELVLLCSVSSLLFNANPLVRLDGYYVLSDMLGIANLQARGWAALRGVLLWPLGMGQLVATRAQAGLALYSALSWIWRWMIFAAMFWLAGGVSSTLAYGFAGVVGVLYGALPLARGVPKWIALARTAPRRAAIAPAVLGGGALLLMLVPVPHHAVAEGVAWNDSVAWVFAPADGILREVAPAGATAGLALRLDNPELRRTLAQLHAERDELAIEGRRARAEELQKVEAIAERQRAVAAQIGAIDQEMALWSVPVPTGHAWHPLRAETLASAWVRRDDRRPLGMVIGDGPVTLRMVLDQWEGPAALAALAAPDGRVVPVRRRGEAAASLHAVVLQLPTQARDELPSPALSLGSGGRIPVTTDARGNTRPAGRVFEVRLAPQGRVGGLHQGARVEARIRLADTTLASLAWKRLRQALQRYLDT